MPEQEPIPCRPTQPPAPNVQRPLAQSSECRPATGAPLHHMLHSQTETAPVPSVLPALQIDPQVLSQPEAGIPPAGEVDWSGLSFEEGGRTYQGYMPQAYVLPNDAEEQDRMDFQHAITQLILGDGRNYLAPIGTPRYVLDIGAGTGIWCLEFAEKNPESLVVGTDLCLVQAKPRTDNCIFILENSETAEWRYPYTFDYVHMRSVGPCFDNIRTVIQKSFDSMTPGGWIELQDGDWRPKSIDNSLEGTALKRWFDLVIEGGGRMGRDMLKAPNFKNYLTEAGFVDVEVHIFQVPGNPWAKGRRAKQLGLYSTTVFLQIVDSYSRFLALAGLTQTEIDKLIPAVKKDLHNMKIHWYLETYYVYGRKPMPPQLDPDGSGIPWPGGPPIEQE